MSSSFLSLPDEVIIVIGSHLASSSIISLANMARLSKRIRVCFSSDVLWKGLVLELLQKNVVEDKETTESWKDFYKRITEWKWDTNRKAEELVISPSGKTVSRPTTLGSNPAILSTRPFSKSRNFFEVCIDSMGDWVSIGVSTSKLKVDGGGVLDRSLFFQGSSKLQYPGSYVTEISGKRIPDLKQNDIVGIGLDVETKKLSFSLNGKHLQFANLFASEGEELRKAGELWFPALGLSHNTQVSFTARCKPYQSFLDQDVTSSQED